MVRTREEDIAQSDRVRVEDTLTLSLTDNGNEVTLAATVKEIHDTHLVVNLPVGTIALEPDTRFVAAYARDDAAYSFESQVISESGLPAECMAIACPQQVERTQRRRYFRIPVDYSATVIPYSVTATANSASARTRVRTAQCFNASGNGVLIGCDATLEPGQHLLLRVELPGEGQSVDAIGRVARVGAHDGKRFSYGIGIFTSEELREEFSNEILMQLPPQYRLFGEKQRTTLINQLFARQAELRQTGML